MDAVPTVGVVETSARSSGYGSEVAAVGLVLILTAALDQILVLRAALRQPSEDISDSFDSESDLP